MEDVFTDIVLTFKELGLVDNEEYFVYYFDHIKKLLDSRYEDCFAFSPTEIIYVSLKSNNEVCRVTLELTS